jgi:flagellar biosynthesis/type III secretory pathway M-ring protein FliF/YscJ
MVKSNVERMVKIEKDIEYIKKDCQEQKEITNSIKVTIDSTREHIDQKLDSMMFSINQKFEDTDKSNNEKFASKNVERALIWLTLTFVGLLVAYIFKRLFP